MSYSLIFSYTLIAFGACFGILALFTFFGMIQKNISNNEKIPRNFMFGALFAVIDVIWCVPQALAIFSPGSSSWIFPVAIIFLIVGCFFLDYLFARALAGFLILLSHYFLMESFAADIPFIWLFSIFCYAMGTFAIVIGGIPHLLRDLIRQISLNRSWRISFTIIFTYYFLIGVITGASVLLTQ